LSFEGQEQERLKQAVGRARRRFRANQALREATVAATIGLLGPTLVLLTGRQSFSWPLVGVFAVTGLAVAIWRWRRRSPTLYHVAQVLDTRLHTQDQISTAVHYLGTEGPAAVHQRRLAVSLAEAANLEAAFPFTMPRAIYGLASVFLVVSTLWALRYFLDKPAPLERPLTRMLAQALQQDPPPRGREGEQYLQGSRNPNAVKSEAFPLTNEEQRDPTVKLEWPEVTTGSTRAMEADDPERSDKEGEPGGDSDGGEMGGETAGMGMQDDPIQSYEDLMERDAKDGITPTQAKHGQDSQQNPTTSQGENPESSNLLSKLREAMNNMMSRLQQRQGSQNQQASAGEASQGGEDEQGKQGDGSGTAGQAQSEGDQAAQGEGAESASNQMGAKGSAGETKAMKGSGGSNSSSGEGSGKEEGDKKIAEAQQLEAMGLLTDLYGRRSANVTGEFTVEAPSGKQNLRTPRQARQGRHADTGGEVSRDEIPLAYQAYVKEYFEKIRQNPKKEQ
jgi:hypothetical protein